MADDKKTGGFGSFMNAIQNPKEAVKAMELGSKVTAIFSNPLGALTNPAGTAKTAVEVLENADNKVLASGGVDQASKTIKSAATSVKGAVKMVPGGDQLGGVVDSASENIVKGVKNIAELLQKNGVDKQIADLVKGLGGSVQMEKMVAQVSPSKEVMDATKDAAKKLLEASNLNAKSVV